MSDPRSVARRYYDAFNRGDLEAYAALLDEDVEVALDATTLRGREAARAAAEHARHASPGIALTPQRLLADDGTVVAELRQSAPAADEATGAPSRTTWEILGVREGRITHVRRFSAPSPGARTGAVRVPSPGEAHHLADEQDALRHVATLVTGGAPEGEVFDAVSRAVARVLGADAAALLRFEADDTLTLVAGWSRRDVAVPVGRRRAVDPELRDIRRTGEPRRFDAIPGTARFAEHDTTGLGTTSAIGVPICVDGRVWGIVVASPEGAAAFPPDTERRMVGFTALAATALANAQARIAVQELAEEQAALRRVAELVARGAPDAQVHEAVVREASTLIEDEATTLLRFDEDGRATVLATCRGPAPVGTRFPVSPDDESTPAKVLRTGRPARLDLYPDDEAPAYARAYGVGSSVGAPVVVEDRAWGMLGATTPGRRLPVEAERRLQQFAELVAAAIANTQARAELQQLADEQAALRRVAELVAQAVPPEEVLAAVVTEASTLLGDAGMSLLRFRPEGDAVVVATHRETSPVGLVVPTDGAPWAPERLREQRALRVRSFENTPAEELARRYGVDAVVVVPVMVEARIWGMLSTTMPGGQFPAGTEERLAQFAELAGIAVANAESRAQLTASRARVVAAADESRRRLQRDVHDGAQQRLVQTVINLKLARQALEEHPWPAAHLIDEALLHAERASDELRDLVRGILPASLSRGGLRAGVDSLCAGLPIEIDLHVTAPRLPAATETTAYFVIAEALANVVKHAGATFAEVRAFTEDDLLTVQVRDDGVGGADPRRGSGLTGLFDRVEAGEGTLVVESPAGGGTTLRATLPVIR